MNNYVFYLSEMTTDQGDTSTIILIATLFTTLLALVVLTMLVAICACKKILRKKQNQFQQEVYYSVIGPPTRPKGNANMPHNLNTNPAGSIGGNQATNPAYGMNITTMSDQGNTSEQKLRDSNLDCCHIDTMQLSSNPAYGTNVSIAPEIDCEENVAYEQRDPNVECRNRTMQLSSNSAYGTNVAIAPEK